MIKLVNVYQGGRIIDGAIEFLYRLMEEREPEINISHSEMPTLEQHRAFMNRRPFRHWYLVEASDFNRNSELDGPGEHPWIGYISATHRNEIGIVLRHSWRAHGFGPEIVKEFIRTHDPVPAEPSVRSGKWLANIAPTNAPSLRMFQDKLGGRLIQHTIELEPGRKQEEKL